MALKNERLSYIIIRAIPFVFNRIKNLYFSFIFSAKNIIVGKNVSFIGTRNISIGSNVSIGNQGWLDAIGDGKIEIGNHVSFSQNVHIAARKEVCIGDGCLIGSDVLVTDHDHSFLASQLDVYPKLRPLQVKGRTVLGRNVWLADNVKVLSGVSLGDNTIVAANSVVTTSFDGCVLIGGIPAKKIKNLN